MTNQELRKKANRLNDSAERFFKKDWTTISQIPQIIKDEVIAFMKLGYGWLEISARTDLEEWQVKEIIHEYEVFQGIIKDY